MSGATLDELVEFVAVLVEAGEVTAADGGVAVLRQAVGRDLDRTVCLRLILKGLESRAQGRGDGWW